MNHARYRESNRLSNLTMIKILHKLSTRKNVEDITAIKHSAFIQGLLDKIKTKEIEIYSLPVT